MKLFKHQAEALQTFWTLPSGPNAFGLFDEQGLGKTFTMLCHLAKLCKTTPIFPVLIVCPKNVMPVWQKEILSFSKDLSVMLTGPIKGRQKAWAAMRDKERFFIINYEGFRSIDFGDALPTTIICDESHRMKSIKSLVTTKFLKVRDSVPNKFILSGTPIGRSPEDIWPQAEFICPNSLGSIWAFRSRYIASREITLKSGKRVKIPVGTKNMMELNQKLSAFSIRRTKKDCLDLPEKIYQTAYAFMEGEQLKAYQALASSLKAQLQDKSIEMSNALVQLSKLRQILQGFLYTDTGTITFEKNAKLLALFDLFEDLLISNKKIIIMSEFIEDIKILDNFLREYTKEHKKEGEVWDVFIYGGEAQERKQIEDAFNRSNQAFLISTIGKIKEGVTLTTSSVIIYYANTYNYISRAQSEDRIHRIGQSKDCIYIDLVVSESIDEAVLSNLHGKRKMADAIVDGVISEGGMEREILSLLKGD
jgi:SNF2 family DNA or RNA helicase